MYYDRSHYEYVRELANRLHSKSMYISNEFMLLSSLNDEESLKEFDRLYEYDIDVIYKYKDFLEDGGVCFFNEEIHYNMELPYCIHGNIVCAETNQVGSYDLSNRCINIYFSLKQFGEMKNNYDCDSMITVILHELVHAVDLDNYYYRSNARLFVSSDLSKNDLDLIVSLNPHIYDVLYRLWSDTELNAQPYTITDEVIEAIKDGVSSLESLRQDHTIYNVIQDIISHDRNNNFKKWFIRCSYKRLHTLLKRVIKTRTSCKILSHNIK